MDNLKFTGKLNVVLRDKDGIVKQQFTCPNLVVTTGLNYIVNRIKDASVTAVSHMAIGSDATVASAGQTALVTESARVAFDSATVTGAGITFVATYAAGTGTGDVNEAGIFNAGAAGTMLARTLFAATIAKGASDSLEVTWTITAAG